MVISLQRDKLQSAANCMSNMTREMKSPGRMKEKGKSNIPSRPKLHFNFGLMATRGLITLDTRRVVSLLV